jgi:lipopolysaccharide transport system ATP-binding protein
MQWRGRGGAPARVGRKVKAKVRYWLEGHQILYPDAPGQRIDYAYPTYAPFKILESVPGEGYPVTVGKYTGIHYSTVVIIGGQHHLEWVGTLHAHVEDGDWVTAPDSIGTKGPVVIGNDVFIGYEAVITSGVTIADGAVVAARSVVARSVEPYSVVAGNPAKHIKYRFDEPTREALLRIKWWDWSTEKVAQHKDQINSPDVEGFVARHDPDLGTLSCELCR